jgi:hypothetical protein
MSVQQYQSSSVASVGAKGWVTFRAMVEGKLCELEAELFQRGVATARVDGVQIVEGTRCRVIRVESRWGWLRLGWLVALVGAVALVKGLKGVDLTWIGVATGVGVLSGVAGSSWRVRRELIRQDSVCAVEAR